MAVNTPPFAPILRIYPGGNPVDTSSWPVGADISSYIRHPGNDGGAPIVYSAGRPDEKATNDPGRMTLTLDNRGGEFSTRNPYGPWYGLLRRGTPITLSMLCGEDDFSRTVSSGLGTSSGGGAWDSTTEWTTDGSSAQAAIAAPNSVVTPLLGGADTKDFDARVTVWPTVAATGAALVYGITARANTARTARLFFSLEFDVAGAMRVQIRRMVDSSWATLANEPLVSTYVANDKWRIRVQGIGGDIRLKVWKPAAPATPDADEPDAWTLSATDTTAQDSKVGLYLWRVNGNTNVGTVDFKISDFQAEAIEFAGSVVEWPARWNKAATNCWAPITAAGVLRRIRQGAIQLRSPLYRQLSSYAPIAYWPLEDDSGATTFGSAVSGVAYARGINATAGGDATLAGASTAPVLSAASASIRATSGRRQSGTGFAVLFFMRFPTAVPTNTVIATYSCAGRITTWELSLEGAGTQMRLRGLEPDGTVVIDNLGVVAGIDSFTNWVAWQLEAEMVAGTVDMTLLWHQVGDDVFYALADSYSSSVAPRCYGANLGGSSVDQVAYSHLWIGENTLPFVDFDFIAVADGYRGELASDRIARLCEEENIPVAVEPGDSEPLGPQRVGSFLDTIEQAAAADYGILYEAGAGFGYRPRSSRYNRPVHFDLSVAAGDIDQPPEPTDDDQRVVNDFTASRIEGSSARVYDAAHALAEGSYTDSASLNVATDDVLPSMAGWPVYLGTRPDLRWPGLSLNLAAQPSLIPYWRSKPYGPRIRVETGLDQMAGSDPDVIAEGYDASLEPYSWSVTMNCSAAKPWDMTDLDDLRMDTAGCVLDADETTTSTSWTVETTSGPIWAPTSILPGEVPFTIICEGEECSVTNVGDLSGGVQVLTVVRSMNGIVKAHAAGASLSLAEPTYLAL